MKTGSLVAVKTFSDGVVERRVVEIVKDTVYICTEKEWRSAMKDGREPESVYFNWRYIVTESDRLNA